MGRQLQPKSHTLGQGRLYQKMEHGAHAQVEAARGAEQEAQAAAEEVEALRRTISQLPRPTMASRSETGITLSLARLARTSGEDKVREALSAAGARADRSICCSPGSHFPKSCLAQTWEDQRRRQGARG